MKQGESPAREEEKVGGKKGGLIPIIMGRKGQCSAVGKFSVIWEGVMRRQGEAEV